MRKNKDEGGCKSMARTMGPGGLLRRLVSSVNSSAAHLKTKQAGSQLQCWDNNQIKIKKKKNRKEHSHPRSNARSAYGKQHP